MHRIDLCWKPNPDFCCTNMIHISIISEIYEVYHQKGQMNGDGEKTSVHTYTHTHTHTPLPDLLNSWQRTRSMNQPMNVYQEAWEETMHSSLLKFNFVTYLSAMKIRNEDNKKGNRGTFFSFLYWNKLLFVQHLCAPSWDHWLHFPFVMLDVDHKVESCALKVCSADEIFKPYNSCFKTTDKILFAWHFSDSRCIKWLCPEMAIFDPSWSKRAVFWRQILYQRQNRAVWLSYQISWYSVDLSPRCHENLAFWYFCFFQLSLPVLIAVMCQTHAVSKPAMPNCCLSIPDLYHTGSFKGHCYFLYWKSKEQAVPSSAGTCLDQMLTCTNIPLTAIFLLEKMPHSAGVLVASTAYFGCLLITKVCRAATHCYIHRLEIVSTFGEQSFNYSLIGASCSTFLARSVFANPGVKESYFLVSRVP